MELLYKIYFAFPNFKRYGFFGKVVNKIFQKILKFYFDKTVPKQLIKTFGASDYGLNTEKRDSKYIVSLTSFPSRINEIWITIDLVLRQTFKPDMVILWLANEQFENLSLPESLLKLKEKGLTIRFCDDLRSHKKYYYSMKEFKDSIIITVDDDVYYPKDFLSKIIEFHKKFPEAIIANKAHSMKFRQETVLPYRKWRHNDKSIKIPSHLLVAVGVGGVLYPPRSLSNEVFDQEVFKEICFFADDLWLKINALLINTKVVATDYYNKDFITIGKTQRVKLVTQNALHGGNDVQLKNLCEHFNIDLSDYAEKK